ncbi:phosphonate C-P lyase system protein PhnH [Nonomuraea sediminis]|uniref:phosphonate C-P lyase system protein PhnH n=1 Tax=Nonomuraea sediminis TaxID=2835864 RepID=UPI001BDC992D|nr:phosphonate C-P lyase system protein PhnH [Nonomuraea sediminis]
MIAAAGRTADQAQADFRALINALARPGTLERIAPCAGPPALAVAGGLADVEVPTAVLGEEHLARALHLATSAPVATLGTARMVVALRPPTPEEIAAMPRGDALHPELGTRLILAVATLSESSATVRLSLSGPGVPGSRSLGVTGMPTEVFTALATANGDFPAGIDTFLVAADGTVAGLPRSIQIGVH